MSGLDKNRLRNSTISFRVSPEERIELEARIKVSGMPKGQYFVQSLLHQRLSIAVGKYQSDRLSLEIKKLRETLDSISETEKIAEILKECHALLNELQKVITENTELSAQDFQAKKKS